MSYSTSGFNMAITTNECRSIGLLLEYGIHTLDRNGLGGLTIRYPDLSTRGETQVQFLV
jgi:hypothetical protein